MLFWLGLYVGGSLVVLFFWTSGGDLSDSEKSLYRNMLFLWPAYVSALFLYRAINYFRSKDEKHD